MILGASLVMVLLLAVACGGAAPAEQKEAPAAEKPAAAAKAQPTAAPKPAAAQEKSSPEINPGKLTWMVGSFANERMTYCLAGGGGHDYGRLIHGFLLEADVIDGARVIVPGIAHKWEVSPDGKTWTVDIREGVKFQDGTELTAEDVLWTWQWGMGIQAKDYATGGACLSNSQLTETMELSGSDQVKVTFNTVFLDFEDDFGSAGGNWIGTVYPAGLGEGTDVLHDEAVEAAYDRTPNGAGPFKLVKHVASDLMEFERFDGHYYTQENGFSEDRRAKFNTLELRLVPEVATRVAALRAGEVDIAPVSLGAKDQVEAGGGQLQYGQEGAHFFARLLGCWEPDLPCHDIKVRQALNYAVDRQSMQKHLFGGPDVFVPRGFVDVTPSTIAYSAEIDPFPFDPEKARTLLAEAGYKTPDNPGGKDFGKFIVNTWQSAAVPNLPDAAQFVAETWQNELGIDATVRVSEESAVKKATRLTEDWFGQVLFRDNETRLDASGKLNGNYGRNKDRPDRSSRDPEVVALAKEIRVIIDPAVRVPRLNEFYIRARDESNELFMGYVNIPWGVGPRVSGWEPSPMAFYVNETHTITLAD